MERELRQHQSTLAITGIVVILFSIWSVIKVLLISLSSIGIDSSAEAAAQEDAEFANEMAELGIDDDVMLRTLLIIFAVIFIVIIIDLLLRVYIGRSAIAEAGGKKKRIVYVVFAFILAGFSLYLTTTELLDEDLFNSGSGIVSTVVTMAVDVTSNITLLILAITAIRVKRIK